VTATHELHDMQSDDFDGFRSRQCIRHRSLQRHTGSHIRTNRSYAEASQAFTEIEGVTRSYRMTYALRRLVLTSSFGFFSILLSSIGELAQTDTMINIKGAQ